MTPRRLKVGKDGNCWGVILGDMPEGKAVFVEIKPEVPEREDIMNAVQEWHEKFPEEGQLEYDVE